MKGKRSSSADLFYDSFESPVGVLYLLFRGKSLAGISFEKPTGTIRKGNSPPNVKKELREYFEHGRQEFTQQITLEEGTDFERKVWLALKEIPYGETRTYKWLAEKIGKSGSFRAVGQALGRNPVPIILPCHRVIESNGSLGGYSAGVDIKRRLLDIEYYVKMAAKD